MRGLPESSVKKFRIQITNFSSVTAGRYTSAVLIAVLLRTRQYYLIHHLLVIAPFGYFFLLFLPLYSTNYFKLSLLPPCNLTSPSLSVFRSTWFFFVFPLFHWSVHGDIGYRCFLLISFLLNVSTNPSMFLERLLLHR